MQAADWMIVLAVLLGPLIAIQVQKWLELARENKRRKIQVFQALMSSRASRLTELHVQALNMIDIEFAGNRIFGRPRPSESERKVLDAWRIHLDHLNTPFEVEQLTKWTSKREELLVDLLYAMAHCLGYHFDKVLLKRGVYFPQAHSDQDLDQFMIRQKVLEIVTGQSSVPVNLVMPDEAVAKQAELQSAMLDHYQGKQPIKIQLEQEDASKADSEDKT